MSQSLTSQISQLFAAGRFAEAEKLCLSAAETNPGDSTVTAIRGAIRLETGDLKSAVAFLSRAVNLDPRNAMAHFNLGVAHKKQMQLEMAMTSFRTALGLAGPRPMILTAMGLTELARGRNPEAAVILEQAAQKDAKSPVAFLNWGEALKRSGQHEKAIRAFTQALALQPSYADALNSIGSIYAETSRPEEAEEHFRRALSINPSHAMARNNLGVLLKSQEKLAEALKEFEAANTADPNYAMAYFNAGTVLKDLNRLQDALEALRRAVHLRPDLAEAHLVIGWIHFDNDSLKEAQAALTRAVEVKPDYVDAHVALGALYRRLRNWKEARMSYDRALAVDFQHFEALVGLGQIFHNQGLSSAADECFRRALERQPGEPAARLALAKALLDQGKLDEAEACCREILGQMPNNSEAHLTLGDILHKQWRLDDALPAYVQSIELAANSTRPFIRLAEALEELGREKELAELQRRLAASEAEATSDALRIKILFTLADVTGDLAPYERALDVALATGRTADISFHPVMKPTMRLEPTKAASVLERMKGLDEAVNQKAALYRARSLLKHELKAYHEAWEDLMRANALVLASSEVDLEQNREYRPNQLEKLKNSSWAPADERALEQCQPVFILGTSRSGKSTLAGFLASSDEWTNLDEYSIVEETFRGSKTTRDGIESGSEPDQARQFAAELVRRCKTHAERGAFSFTAPGYVKSAKFLTETMPGVKFILVRRDPMDVTLRCLQKLYKNGNYYSYHVQECVSYLDWYNAMMDELSTRLGERARTVRYEDLVADAPAVVASLWQWLGVKPARDANFAVSSDVGCSQPYRDLIAAALS
jgi:tetratricopeptide (TPR) repeat protein